MTSSAKISYEKLLDLAREVEISLQSGDVDVSDYGEIYFTYSERSLLASWHEQSSNPDDYDFHTTLDTITSTLKLPEKRSKQLLSKSVPTKQELVLFAELRDIEPNCLFHMDVKVDDQTVGYALYEYQGGGQWFEITLVDVFRNLTELEAYVAKDIRI